MNIGYSLSALDHFENPRNVGKMANPDGTGTYGDPGCGDTVTIYIKVRSGLIVDISFLVFGCVTAIATSSITTELAKGRTPDEAYRISESDVLDVLEGLPEAKVHYSLLGPTALKAAIDDYHARRRDGGIR